VTKISNTILSSRDSSVGRALDWRSKGPRFDPGSRHFCKSFSSVRLAMNSNKMIKAPPRVELGISCLRDRRFNQLSHGAWITLLSVNHEAKSNMFLKTVACKNYFSPNVGLEPTTLRLRVSCSTDWASRATLTTCALHFVGLVYAVGTRELTTRTAHVHASNVGSVVECSPATRAARVRFPDVAAIIFILTWPNVV
jgi:hypothetical protein